MTLVMTSGAEKLAEDTSQLRKREGADLSRSMKMLARLAGDLANKPHPDRVVSYRCVQQATPRVVSYRCVQQTTPKESRVMQVYR